MSKVGQRLIGAAREASSIARGEKKAARLHVPAEIDVKGVRHKLKLSQEDFASEFGFSVTQIKDWEQGRSRPIGGVRAYIMLIDSDGEAVRRLLWRLRHNTAPNRIFRAYNHEEEAHMETQHETTRDAIVAAGRAVTNGEDAGSALGGALARVTAELDLQLWDVRLAACLNTLDIARQHGNHREWTSEHAAQIRAMMAISESVVGGDQHTIVPQGFGPPVRSQMAAIFVKAREAHAKAAAAAAPPAGLTPAGSADAGEEPPA